ncbi:MAG: type IX secretion system sortase PorU, partial [Bacteroidales bacterium]|nr:type IX secretion system sortase PorU [Bacteroidales bacterium]
MMNRFLLSLLTIFLFLEVPAQVLLESKTVQLQWQANDSLQLPGKEKIERLSFKGAFYPAFNSTIPYFKDRLDLFDKDLDITATLSEITVEPLDEAQMQWIENITIPSDFTVRTTVLTGRDEAFVQARISSLRLNPVTQRIERLSGFKLNYFYEAATDLKDSGTQFATQSVLATGTWHKMRINKSGIFKISYSELQAMGINVGALNPKNIRIYGNGGGPIAEANRAFRYDDLFENPIVVVGEEDNVFNQNDYILFYGQGPLVWDFDAASGFFDHRPTYYDDYSYYFITTDLGAGKRIQTQNPQGEIAETVTSFLDHQLYEQDLVNLSNTGRTWYGDLFDVNLSKDFTFDFPNIDISKKGRVITDLAARAFGPSGFQLSVDANVLQTISIDATQETGYDWAKGNGANRQFFPAGDRITVNLKYNRSLNSSRGWLDFIEVNAYRNLRFTSPQMHFNNTKLFDTEVFVKMEMSGASSAIEVWDISEAVNPFKVQSSLQGDQLTFLTPANQLHQFVAFDKSSFLSVENVGLVANQNLHGIRDVDYLIITHPDFLEQAQQLAQIHRDESDLTVLVTTPSLIYNEFSSGAQDVSAIRDFARMLYSESSVGKKLRYLMLFGDASFDYKDKLNGNTNYVPTYETVASLNLVNSIATDDYYGYLDRFENGAEDSLLDIGIGRFPVATALEAEQMVDKVVKYISHEPEVMAPWRNEITLISDDGDTNQHLSDSENIAAVLREDYPDFNLVKIHLDAYKQIATPGGQKAPEVNEAINKKMARGTLIVNYSGHGGEIGWTEEKILQIADINSWRNRSKLPVFITATCEFSRYDDPERMSAGEMVFMNPSGGAIAMFTTARATYSATNLRLNRAIFNDNVFEKSNGEYPRFGDVIRRSKLVGDPNDRKFVLLGDPALQLSFPKEKVVTTHINGNPVGSSADTLKALDITTVRGIVANNEGQQLTNFDGVLYAIVYDKENQIKTLGDQGPTSTFLLRSSILHKSTVEVKNGNFEFTFMMPKDIGYQYGPGKISYYATDLNNDAQGSYENFLVGGFSHNTVDDNDGPNIRLFIGDTTFVSGGFTDENPNVLALLSDENGINTTGSGIGHDLVATLTGATERYAIINEFYSAKLNKSSEGIVVYPFSNLKAGKHTLTLKAWDILTNSNTATIEFEVVL